MNRRLLALLLAVPLVALAFVAVVGPSAPPPPYVEYGEPADRPYVVLRVYGGPVFDANDTVVADVVLVNPWDRNASVQFISWPYASMAIVASNGTFVYSDLLVSIDLTMTFPLAPGGELVVTRWWWRPTAVHRASRTTVDPVEVGGSTFCNRRVDGETYTIRVGFVDMRITTDDGRTTDGDGGRFDASVAFAGTPGPCLAEDPPVLDLRVDGDTFGLNGTVAIDLVLVNPTEERLSLSLDFTPAFDVVFLAPNGTTLYDANPIGYVGVGSPTLDEIDLSLPPRGERPIARLWWNASSLAIHRFSPVPGVQHLSYVLPPRVPGPYTIVATVNWLSLWDGAPYDWDATPAPLRVALQEVQATVTFT